MQKQSSHILRFIRRVDIYLEIKLCDDIHAYITLSTSLLILDINLNREVNQTTNIKIYATFCVQYSQQRDIEVAELFSVYQCAYIRSNNASTKKVWLYNTFGNQTISDGKFFSLSESLKLY